MGERKFVKLRVDIYDDTKAKIIDTKPQRDFIHHCFTRLIVLAGKVNREGELYLSKNIPYTVETLALEFSRSVEEIELALNVLIELEMVEINESGIYRVKNFAKHQNIKVKEKNNAEDKRKDVKEEETLGKENCNNHIVVLKDLDKENNKDKNSINNKLKNLDSLPREVLLNNENSTNESEEQDSKSNNLIQNKSNKNSNELTEVNGMREVTLISLENKKDRGKNKKERKKEKEFASNSYDEEDEDMELCSLYEGEMVLGEGERIIKSWVFD